jgi:hypothetical protein
MSAQATNPTESQIPEPNISRVLFADTRLAPVWLLVRVYLGILWLLAGWEKLTDPAGVWVGGKAGAAVAGFAQGAIKQTAGEHPQVTGWYAGFLKDVVIPNAVVFLPGHVRRGSGWARPDPRPVHRHRCVLRRDDERELHIRRSRGSQSAHVHTGGLDRAGLARCRVLEPRPLGPASCRRPRSARNHILRTSRGKQGCFHGLRRDV